MSNKQEAPNVVSESALKVLVEEEGHALEIVCQSEPWIQHGQWRGSWFLKAVDVDNDTEKLLVPFRVDPRKGIQVREFKTANGVLSFARALDFDIIPVPMAEGRKVRIQKELPQK